MRQPRWNERSSDSEIGHRFRTHMPTAGSYQGREVDTPSFRPSEVRQLRAGAIRDEAETLEKKAQAEEARWDKERGRVEQALRRARE